jgi:SAM-dependent methyltransferase
MTTAGPNADQERYWNETAGPTWVRLNDVLDGMIAPIGRLAMDRAGLVAGERVLDVGCGCGNTTVELARRVAPGGSVTGVDVSAPMLALARERAAGVDGVRFEQGDAQVHPFPPSAFDVVFSRFGVMFFVDPTAAFANLRAALRSGGRVAFVCWQWLPVNDWMRVPVMAAAQVVALPPPPAPDAPGPFSFGDPDRVRAILGGAGFVEVDVAPHEGTLTLPGGGDIDATVDFVLQMGPAAAALREAADPDVRPRAAKAVREALLPYVTPEGPRMAYACWLVSARRP